MWLVFKIKKKRLNQFREDLEKKIDKNFLIYSPKILIKKIKNTREKSRIATSRRLHFLLPY